MEEDGVKGPLEAKRNISGPTREGWWKRLLARLAKANQALAQSRGCG